MRLLVYVHADRCAFIHAVSRCAINEQVVEAGLGHLPFTEKTVVTPTGRQYVGVDFAKKLCGVSIIRSGESMENALRACCKGVKIGKILVHRCDDGLYEPHGYVPFTATRLAPPLIERDHPSFMHALRDAVHYASTRVKCRGATKVPLDRGD